MDLHLKAAPSTSTLHGERKDERTAEVCEGNPQYLPAVNTWLREGLVDSYIDSTAFLFSQRTGLSRAIHPSPHVSLRDRGVQCRFSKGFPPKTRERGTFRFIGRFTGAGPGVFIALRKLSLYAFSSFSFFFSFQFHRPSSSFRFVSVAATAELRYFMKPGME